jgi:hypothetical protein
MPNGANRPGWLVGAVSVIGLLLSAVGIGTGEVPRVLRNHPVLGGSTFVLVVVGSLVGAAGAWHVRLGAGEHRWRAHAEVVVGASLLAIAAVLAVITGIVSATERPDAGITTAIAVNRQGRQIFRFAVKDSGLKSSEKMTIRVTALTYLANSKVPLRTPLFGESLGPNTAGDINQQGELLVPPAPANDLEVQAGLKKLEECSGPNASATEAEHPGCSRLHIVRAFEKPQLTIAWRNDRHSRAGLFVHVTAHDLGEHRIVLRIVDSASHHLIVTASWPPTASGIISKSLTAIVPGFTRRLCVAASTTQSEPTCFPPGGSGTSICPRAGSRSLEATIAAPTVFRGDTALPSARWPGRAIGFGDERRLDVAFRSS